MTRTVDSGVPFRPYLPGAVPWPKTDAARWRAAGYWSGQTFTDLLVAQAADRGPAVAVVEGPRRTTYAELLGRSQTLARGLRELGIRRQDRVVVQLGNVTEFFEVCFALYAIGAVPVFALPAHRGYEIGHLLNQSGARGYVLAQRHGRDDLRELGAAMLRDLPRLEHVIVHGDRGEYAGLRELADCYPAGAVPNGAVPNGAVPNGAVPNGAVPNGAVPNGEFPRPDEVAFLQLSGGSTGMPKLIPRTHDEYLYTLRESARICGLTASSVYLAVLPIAHNYPMSSPGCFGIFAAGGRVVLAADGDPAAAAELIDREGVTIVALVPPLALMWADALSGRDLAPLSVVQVGGAPFPPSAARRVVQALPGVTLQQVFGMAEGLVCYTRLDDPLEVILGCQGQPISVDDELLVVDEDDRPVPPGGTGHLLTRGPYTIRGYYAVGADAIAHNAVAFTPDGHYRTGDLVSVDEHRRVRVMGRAKDQINRGGEKVAVDEVEDHLLTHPDIHDASVVAIPDDLLGERSCAVLVTRDHVPLRRRDVVAHLTARGVAAFKFPDRVLVVEAFPETGVGKTSKRDLRAALRRNLLDPERTS